MKQLLGEIIGKSTIACFVFVLATSQVFASNISLSEIEISPNLQKGYNISLKTNKNIKVKQHIKGNLLTIDLKNTTTTSDFTTNYKNVSGIDNIMVSNVGDKNTKIQIKGNNITNSQINVETPFIQPKITKEYTTTATASPIIPSKIPTQSQQNGINWVSFLGLAIIVMTAKKTISQIGKKEQSVSLTKNSIEREKEIAKNLNVKAKEIVSLRHKINTNVTTPSINYIAKPTKQHLHNLTTVPIKPINTKIKISTTPIQQKQINIDSMKFLESMTKIYEQNGRQDLASNLKKNLHKIHI